MRTYAVVYSKGETSWGAHVPDLPGCIAVARTLEETQALMREAIAFHIEGLILGGEPIPEPSTLVGEIEVAA